MPYDQSHVRPDVVFLNGFEAFGMLIMFMSIAFIVPISKSAFFVRVYFFGKFLLINSIVDIIFKNCMIQFHGM